MVAETTDWIVRDADRLRSLMGEVSDVARRKQLEALDPHCQAFIRRSPFVLVATANAGGRCDVSPRGDPPGFVQIVDGATLLLPERAGNRRVDSLHNLIENPGIGLIFLIPGVEETLRVNGTAEITVEPALLASMAVNGRPPVAAVRVTVEEAFLHCAKSFKRGKVWQPEAWPPREETPSLARMVKEQLNLPQPLEALEAAMAEDYKRLY